MVGSSGVRLSSAPYSVKGFQESQGRACHTHPDCPEVASLTLLCLSHVPPLKLHLHPRALLQPRSGMHTPIQGFLTFMPGCCAAQFVFTRGFSGCGDIVSQAHCSGTQGVYFSHWSCWLRWSQDNHSPSCIQVANFLALLSTDLFLSQHLLSRSIVQPFALPSLNWDDPLLRDLFMKFLWNISLSKLFFLWPLPLAEGVVRCMLWAVCTQMLHLSQMDLFPSGFFPSSLLRTSLWGTLPPSSMSSPSPPFSALTTKTVLFAPSWPWGFTGGRPALFARPVAASSSPGTKAMAQDIRRSSMSRWLAQVISAAYARSGSDLPGIVSRPHEVRAWASSQAFAHSRNLHDIMEAVYWWSPGTFIQFYLGDMSHLRDDGFSGVACAVVAQQTVSGRRATTSRT